MNNHTRYPLVAVLGALAEVPAEVLGVEVLAVALVAVLVVAAALVVAVALVVVLVAAEILVAVYLPEISVMPFRRLRRRHMRSSQRLWQ